MERTLPGTKHQFIILAAEVARPGKLDGALGHIGVSR